MNARLAVLVVVSVAGCSSSPGPDVSKLTTPEEVRDAFLKAAEAKDTATMAKLADLPWLDTNRELVRDRDALAKALDRAAAQAVKPDERKVEALAYKTVRDKIEDAAERKLLDELLGDDGFVVSVENDGRMFSERVLLIRVKDGKAKVVGGPLKPNQLTPTNRIPDAVLKALDTADSFTLYSLEPGRGDRPKEKADAGKEFFHDYEVLGKTEVKAAEDRKKVLDALKQGAEDNGGTAAGCFIPRHGIRVASGKDTIDLVICFQCLSVSVYVNDKSAKGFLTTGDPQPAFDAVLKAAGVKLPKQSGE
jgi:hypothetical protein